MNRTEGVEIHQAYRIEQDYTNRLGDYISP